MPEISDREYNLLLSAIKGNQIALDALTSNLNQLSAKLAERYLTREEDERADQRVRDEMYAYVREQNTIIRGESEDIHRGLQEQIKLCFTVLGILCAAAVAEGGWIILHTAK